MDDYLEAWKEVEKLRKQASKAYDDYCIAREKFEDAKRHANSLW